MDGDGAPGIRDVLARFTVPPLRPPARPVEAAALLEEPGSTGSSRRPDLWWPDDRRWFVATDTDFWSLYVGGDEALIDELASSVPTVVERCGTDTFVNPED